MLSNQWLAVLESRGVGRRPVGVRRFNRDLVLWRNRTGELRCAVDACPHRGAALSRGRLVEGELVCGYHGLRFGSDGRCQHVPAYPNLSERDGFRLSMFETTEAHGLVWVWTGPGPPEAEPPWDTAFDLELREDGGRFSTIVDEMDVSYLRVMENLTDYHHIAHVHRWTTPVPAEVTRFEARREGRHIWARGRLGDGFEASTHIVGPCLALLEFGGVARFAVVATPIDHENVWLCATYTQKVVQLPLIGGVVGWLLGQFDYRLLQRLQDLPVWRSQRLADPADIALYTLLPADEGVRLYFEMHQELEP